MFLLLALNFSSVLLVSGDVGGEGKYLEINFISQSGDFDTLLRNSDCTVKATKLNSEQVFTYLASDSETYSQKVGAGTVLLEATDDESNGWEFCYFAIGEDQLADPYYKTEKYGIVDAIFKRVTQTSDITIRVTSGMGAVYYEGVKIADQTNTPVTITVNYGTNPTFEFWPDDEYHLSSVLVDESYYVDLILTEFTQSYEFPIIDDPVHSLDVAFSIDGEAIIPYGSDITVFLSNAASLEFSSVSGGIAYGSEIFSLIDVVIWDIDVEVNEFGQTIVALRYDPDAVIGAEEDLKMYRSDSEYADIYYQCDLDDDGIVDGQDIKIIANIVKHPKFWNPDENPEYDINGDGAITEEDVHIVNSMKNLDLQWIDITLFVDTENNILYGVTDHFSIFRGR